MALSDLIRELAYLKAGGRSQGQRDIDKINQTFSSISKIGDVGRQYAAEQETMLKNQAEFEKAQLETEKIRSSLLPVETAVQAPNPEELRSRFRLANLERGISPLSPDEEAQLNTYLKLEDQGLLPLSGKKFLEFLKERQIQTQIRPETETALTEQAGIRAQRLAPFGGEAMAKLPVGEATPLAMVRARLEAAKESKDESKVWYHPKLQKIQYPDPSDDVQNLKNQGWLSIPAASTVRPMSSAQRQEESFEEAEEKEKRSLKIKAEKDLQTYSAMAQNALTGLEKVKNASIELGDFGRGVISQTIARGKLAYKEYATDPKFTFYLGTIKQELIPLARNLAEEKGPINISDVDIMEKALGKPTIPLADKMRLLEGFLLKVENALSQKAELAGYDNESFNEKYGNLTTQIQRIKQDLSERMKTNPKENQIPTFSISERSEDKEAWRWAVEHPNDPRSRDIIERIKPLMGGK